MGTLRVSGSDRAGFAGLLAIAIACSAAPAVAAPPVFGPASPLDSRAAVNGALDEPPVVAGSSAGTWIAVWESPDSLGGTIGNDTDLLFVRSPDGGATWSDTAALDPLAASDVAVDGKPAIASDGSGTWIVVWRSDRDDGTGRGDLDLYVSRSTDDGLTWSPGARLHAWFATDVGRDDEPALATDGQGRWVVVWSAHDGDADLLTAHSLDGGATWSAPAPLHPDDAGDDVEPTIASDGRGAWIVVWTSSDPLGGTLGGDQDLLFARSDDGGASWTAPAPLVANAGIDVGHDRAPSLASDGDGRWLVAWQSRDDLAGTIGRDSDILFARSSDGRTWTWPAAVHAYAAGDGSTDVEPAVACGGPGRCAVVWQSNHPLAAGIGTDYDILLATTEDGGESWSEATALDPRATTDAGGDQRPALAADGRGTWIATWQSNDSLGGTIGSDHDPLVAVGVEPPVCGDAVLHRDEACDDGNLLDGDGCDAECRIEAPAPPDEPSLLAFFDAAVADGSLHGVHGRSPGLALLRQAIAVASVLQEAGHGTGACALLEVVRQRVDGYPSPPDFVEGPARPELAQRVEAVREELGCGFELPR